MDLIKLPQNPTKFMRFKLHLYHVIPNRSIIFFMKTLFICIIAIVVSTTSWSQNISSSRSEQPQVQLSNIDRLYLDYEVKDIPNPNHDLVMQINLALYDTYRQENTDVEVDDFPSGYTLILYSTNKTIFNKNRPNTNLNEKD